MGRRQKKAAQQRKREAVEQQRKRKAEELAARENAAIAEAVRELEVVDFPLFVAYDSKARTIYKQK